MLGGDKRRAKTRAEMNDFSKPREDQIEVLAPSVTSPILNVCAHDYPIRLDGGASLPIPSGSPSSRESRASLRQTSHASSSSRPERLASHCACNDSWTSLWCEKAAHPARSASDARVSSTDAPAESLIPLAKGTATKLQSETLSYGWRTASSTTRAALESPLRARQGAIEPPSSATGVVIVPTWAWQGGTPCISPPPGGHVAIPMLHVLSASPKVAAGAPVPHAAAPAMQTPPSAGAGACEHAPTGCWVLTSTSIAGAAPSEASACELSPRFTMRSAARLSVASTKAPADEPLAIDAPTASRASHPGARCFSDAGPAACADCSATSAPSATPGASALHAWANAPVAEATAAAGASIASIGAC
eukprot:scaffold25595_cov112-Isochrysis_galbana.AAC.2